MGAQRILFLWDDREVEGADLSRPEQGNVGVGGTDFLFSSVPHELAKTCPGQIAVLHTNAANRLSPLIQEVLVPPGGRIDETLKWAAAEFDLIVARPSESMMQWVAGLPASARVVAWAHNHLRGRMLNWLGHEPRIVAVVNVGREQMLLTRLSAAYGKSTWIDNPVYSSPACAVVDRAPRAVYMGALVSSKGFHRLARLWPRIRQAVPEAGLDVIGSTDLYGASGAVGERYMARIQQCLQPDAQSLGVTFHGKLGVSKHEVMSRALVGLPNPTGFTETSCLTALEMSSAGLAIVAPRRWGFCDTVSPLHSGRLTGSDAAYVRAVVRLLRDPAGTQALGQSGRQWVAEQFAYACICERWFELFDALGSRRAVGRQAVPRHPTGRYPHGLLYRFDFLGARAQALIDVSDKLVGWGLRR
jgi:glycosyltransferase involved in cell wall biosynthesis